MWLTLPAAALLLYLALIVPNRSDEMHLEIFAQVPLEWLVLIGLMLTLRPGSRVCRIAQVGLALTLTLLLLLKVGDYAIYESFSRPFNLVIDFTAAKDGVNLLVGTLGGFGAMATLGIGFVGLALIVWALAWALGRWARLAVPRTARLAVGALTALMAVYGVADLGHDREIWRLPGNPPGTTSSTQLAIDHVARAAQTTRDLTEFRAATREDVWAGRGDVLDRLAGRDVNVIFLESYGRTSFDNPLYAPTHLETLRMAEREISDQGLAMRSFWLTSPIQGGQSWLAHGTFASGLRTGDQGRYRAMLASPRQTLFHLADQAGFRTGAVMPAITQAWPEGTQMGYQDILAAKDLGYDGLPFNWVTMPDQYTLAAYADHLSDDPRPNFLQITLISSHAPWTPVPWMLDWDLAGDGTAFNDMAQSGQTPREVWRDRDVVRDHYRRSVDYTLMASFSYVARHAAAEPPLTIVLGDHQPAPSISQVPGQDVPIHIIGPPDLLAQIDAWGATEGLVPEASAPVWPMEAFRDRFLAAFTSDPGAS